MPSKTKLTYYILQYVFFSRASEIWFTAEWEQQKVSAKRTQCMLEDALFSTCYISP